MQLVPIRKQTSITDFPLWRQDDRITVLHKSAIQPCRKVAPFIEMLKALVSSWMTSHVGERWCSARCVGNWSEYEAETAYLDLALIFLLLRFSLLILFLRHFALISETS